MTSRDPGKPVPERVRAWFAEANRRFAQDPGFIRRRLLRPHRGGNYVAIVEHESAAGFKALHHTEGHETARRRVEALFDGEPRPTFYEVIME